MDLFLQCREAIWIFLDLFVHCQEEICARYASQCQLECLCLQLSSGHTPFLLRNDKYKYKHKHKTQNRQENSSGHISSFSSISQRQRQANTYIPKLSSGHTLAPSPLLHKHKDKTHKTHETHKAQKGKGYCAGHSGSLSVQAVVNLFVPKKCSFKAPLEIFIIDKMEHHKSCWHISKGGRANF